MKIKILDCNIENVVKGKSRYSKATVAYSYNGEARTQSVMSFTNPDVFKKVQECVGQEVEVTITKNDAGYNTWAAIMDVNDIKERPAQEASTAPPVGLAAAATRVTGSNYETPSERAQKQVYIVKQSSITAAIGVANLNKEKATPEEIIESAQKFVNYVFDTDAPNEATIPN